MGVGGVVFASGLAGGDDSVKRKGRGQPLGNKSDFFFLQLSDTHWGFQGPPNPQADKTLRQVVATINQVDLQPDFIVFTGDLTHTTENREVRHTRMAEFRKIVSDLRVKDLRFMPGEHDAALDAGDAYKEHFGAPNYAFDHKGIHFVAVDNVSDAKGAVGDAQRDWLAGDLKKVGKDAPIVVFTHRPLFEI
jgi:3',5'-cyclic AMP phosphodiesterase CpdA